MVERTFTQQLLELERTKPDGFHGIIRRPDGSEGFLSKITSGGGESISWFLIGEGQDPIDVMKVGKALHEIFLHPEQRVDSDVLRYLGQSAEKLARPKTA